MPKVTVRVPQKDGEIRLAINGDEPTVYRVDNHRVSVPEDVAGVFVRDVPGAKAHDVQPESPAAPDTAGITG